MVAQNSKTRWKLTKYKLPLGYHWAIPEKIQTGDMEFPGVSKKWHVEFPGIN